jgi:integrase
MGTVLPRRRKGDRAVYIAQIAINREGFKHRGSKTFDRKPAATAWMIKREKELAKPGALAQASKQKREPTLAEAIDRYTSESRREIGRTKAQVLAAIKNYPIAGKACSDIGSPDIVEFAKALAARVQRQTVANYLSHLGAVFAIARPAWGYPLDAQAMADANTVARRLGLTAKSAERDRRPTLDELDRLMTHFREIRARRPSTTPMDRVTAFAIFSTRRLEEIVRIAWADLDVEGKRVLVRDMKHPGQKVGNDVWCDLPEPALRIIAAMPRIQKQIFPYSTDAIGAAFTRACQFLAIEDLHFHDLRHEGVSRLFEMGLNIPHVAAVSGHRSWQSLKRYTHLRQSGDKYEGWVWLDRIAPVPAQDRMAEAF